MIDLWLKVKTVDVVIALACVAIAMLAAVVMVARDVLAQCRVRRWNRRADRR